MARAVEQCWPQQTYGTVLTRYGHRVECESIEVVEAAHPVPDKAGFAAAKKIRESVRTLGQSDFAVCLISGGASALLALPHEKIRFEDKRNITQQLLASGADIAELNCVRKHLSAIKGGRLMADIYPAKAHTLCISDVTGDDPSVIGSGPTAADQTTCREALDILNAYQISTPAYVRELLHGKELETPKPGDPIFERSNIVVAAKPDDAFKACIRHAEKIGIKVHFLGSHIEGETNETARWHAQKARQLIEEEKSGCPILILSGGETTVTVTGQGSGGPNTQFALALATELNSLENVYALVCDTDGIDGNGSNAGAWVDPTTLSRAQSYGVDSKIYLNNNGSYDFFDALGDLETTGPTLTNVNDFRAIYFTGR